MKNIITIQHTQSIQHTNGMVGSWTDWELTELGSNHAESIGVRLSAELKGQTYKIYSSDLTRSMQTAAPLARYLKLPVEYRVELREINLGRAIGKTKQWLRENGAPIHSIDDRSFPDAESGRDVWNRLSTFRDEIIKSADENIIIISHSMTLSVWFGIWHKWDIEMYENCDFNGIAGGVSFFYINSNGKHIISRLNDLSYIR